MNILKCPNCGSSDIQLQFPVWVPATLILNEDVALDGGDLIREVFESYEADHGALAWLCTQCATSGDGMPGSIEEVPG